MNTPAPFGQTTTLNNLTVNFDERFQLNNINWIITPNQHWMITGANGAGKSALAAVLADAGGCSAYPT